MMVDKQAEVVDVDEARLMAALCYVGLLIVIPYLLKREDPLVRWHFKQGLVMLLLIILSLMAVAWIKPVGNVLFLILMILDLMAMVQALLGKRWKIPVVYKLADSFKI